jgi:tetratricopeptide (TPR) repeat protein
MNTKGLASGIVLPVFLSVLFQAELSGSAFWDQAGAAREKPAVRALTSEERGDLSMARKSYEDAVDNYYRALKEGSFASAQLWNKLGIAYQELEDHAAARKAYKQATKRQKDYSEPLNNMGTTYFMQKKYRKSVKYYLQALKLDPNSASYHMNLGTSYIRMKKYAEFEEEYRKALSLTPNLLSERSSTGTTMQARGTEPEFYYHLSKVFASLGRPADAVRSLRRAMEEGFNDREKILTDPDFIKINKDPAFVELMHNPPYGIKE